MGALEVTSIILSLVQAASQAANTAAELTTVFKKAQAEGRDLTDAEIEPFRAAALTARARVAD